MPWSFKDFFDALRRPALWLNFAFSDIQILYKQSLIGLAWISVSLGAFIAVKLIVFGPIMNMDSGFYSLWVGVGFWIWTLFVSLVNDSSRAFSTSRSWILGTNLPLSVYMLQVIARAFIRFLFSLPVIVILFAVIGFLPGTSWVALLTCLPGVLMYVITGIWVSMLMATICARYRDIMHFAQTAMQVAFFLTPILYVPRQFGPRANLFGYNPFTHYLAIVRDPLVGLPIPVQSWVIVGLITVGGLIISLLVFQTLGRRTAFYLS